MLIDKPYYDYDYEEVPQKTQPTDTALWSDDKIASIFAAATNKSESELEKAERLQRQANEQYRVKR